MRWIGGFWLRLCGLIWRKRLDRDLEDELQFHLEMRQRENEAAGMTPVEALQAARRRFGNDSAIKETGRDLFGFGPWERVWQDVRQGFRVLVQT